MKSNPIRVGRSTTVLVFISILGSGLAVLREALVAARMGANWEMDAYFFTYAFIVSLPFFILDALQKSFTPIYIHSDEESKVVLFSSVMNFFLIMLFVMTLVVIVIARLSVSSFASGFNVQGQQLVMRMIWILSPTILLLGLWGFFRVILEAEGNFFASAISDTFISFCVIGAILLLGTSLGVYSLLLGVLSSSLLQLIWTAYWLWRQGLKYKLVLDLANPAIRRFLSLLFPPFIAAFMGYAIPIIDRLMASHLPEGTISALSYADKIIMNISGIIIIPLTKVLLPSLSQKSMNPETHIFKKSVYQTLGMLIFILIPISFALVALRLPLVQFFYQRGKLDAVTAVTIASIFGIYAIGLMPSGVSSSLETSFCSLEDTRTASFWGVGSKFISKIFFNFVLIGILGVLGIALAKSLSFVVSSILLLFILSHRLHGIEGKRLITTLFKTVIASFIAIAPYYLIVNYLDLPQIVAIPLGGFLGVLLYFLFTAWLRTPELLFLLHYLPELKRYVQKRFSSLKP